MFYKLQKTGKFTYVYLMDSKREGDKIKSVIVEKLGRYDKLPDDLRALVDQSITEVKEHKFGDARKALISQQSSERFQRIISGIETTGLENFNKLPALKYGHLALLPLWNEELQLKSKIHELQRAHTDVTDWEYADLLFYLCALKVIDPCSYLSAYESKSLFLYCPWEGINLDNYYRALDFAAKFSGQLISHAVKNHLEYVGGDIKMAFFDCTNCYFETPYDDQTWQIIRYTRKRCREKYQEGCTSSEIDSWLESEEFEAELKEKLEADSELIIRMRGKSKENRYAQPIVTVALAIDQTGFPIDMRIFAGNLSEIRTLVEMLDSLRDKYQIEDVYFVADKGLNCTDNLREIGDRGLGFVVSQSVSNKGDKLNEEMLNLEGYRNFSFDGINFSIREAPVNPARARFKVCDYAQSAYVPRKDGSLTSAGKPKKHKITVKCKIAYVFSPTRRKRELQELRNQKARAQLAVENGELMGNSNSTGWRALIKTKKEEATSKIEKDLYRATGIKEDVYNRREKLAGYSAIVFRHPDDLDEAEKLTDEQILGTYHKQVAIEDCFRIMKSTFSVRPMNVRTKSHILGHCTICVLALMLIKSLQKRLDAYGGQMLSAQAIADTLGSAMLVPDPTLESFLNVTPQLKFALLKDLHKHQSSLPANSMEDQEQIWSDFKCRRSSVPDDIDQLFAAVGCTPLKASCSRSELRRDLKLRGYSDKVLISPYIVQYGKVLIDNVE